MLVSTLGPSGDVFRILILEFEFSPFKSCFPFEVLLEKSGGLERALSCAGDYCGLFFLSGLQGRTCFLPWPLCLCEQ